MLDVNFQISNATNEKKAQDFREGLFYELFEVLAYSLCVIRRFWGVCLHKSYQEIDARYLYHLVIPSISY